MSRHALHELIQHNADPNTDDFAKARARHFVYFEGEKSPIELLALKYRTRNNSLKNFTSLHMMVISLRCDHSCPYCQVSRRSENRQLYDMSLDTARESLNLIFQSPSPHIKIEFQGGEPLLNFETIKYVVNDAEKRALASGISIEFVIATTLSLATDEIFHFCRDHNIQLSTSLDGPKDLHNANRPRPGKDSYQRYIAGLKRARDIVGRDKISALMTTTARSINVVKDIIDEYIALEFNEIFLRPLSPYGFAVKTKAYKEYNVEEWINFYKEGLDYIIKLNKQGIYIKEIYASIILQKMLTMKDAGYVDLMSPAGIGLAAVVYNYDGAVYASDESRMLAEMGDKTFKIGEIGKDTYEDIFGADNLLEAVDESMTISSPMCHECGFEPFCGADPVFHHGMYGDFVGRKPESAFCQRNMEIFRYLFRLLEDDESNEILINWVHY